MTHYTVTVPVKGKDDITRYPRVGVMFENRNRETGAVFYTIRLDYPVGVTELLVFPPRPAEAAAAVLEEGAEAGASDTDPVQTGPVQTGPVQTAAVAAGGAG